MLVLIKIANFSTFSREGLEGLSFSFFFLFFFKKKPFLPLKNPSYPNFDHPPTSTTDFCVQLGMMILLAVVTTQLRHLQGFTLWVGCNFKQPSDSIHNIFQSSATTENQTLPPKNLNCLLGIFLVLPMSRSKAGHQQVFSLLSFQRIFFNVPHNFFFFYYSSPLSSSPSNHKQDLVSCSLFDQAITVKIYQYYACFLLIFGGGLGVWGIVYSEDVVGQIEMIHILALGLGFVLPLAVQMTSFVFHSGEKSTFMDFSTRYFLVRPPLF